MSQTRRERDYYLGQCDELGGKVLRLQSELSRCRTALKRSQMATSLILRTYQLIHDDVAMDDIGKQFLQVVLNIMWADRAIVLRREGASGIFEPQHFLGLDQPGTDRLDMGGELPGFIYINSLSEHSELADRISETIRSPYFLWVFDRQAGIALLIGNSIEDRVFRLPFSDTDRQTVESALSVFVDIMERKAAKTELLKSEGRYRRLVQSSPESIFVCSEGSITFANNAGLRMLGAQTPGEILGKPILDFVHSADRAGMSRIMENIIVTGTATPLTEKRFRRLDGIMLDVEVVTIPFTSQDSSAVQLVALDVSERRKMEEELLRVQKIESLGVLAGGIAHDFNNILMGILGNIDLAKVFMDPGQKAYHYLEDAETASRRAQDLTQKLLTFAKGGAPLRKTTLLSDIISDSVSFILSGSRVRFEYDQPKDLRSADIDVVQFRQVIENLTVNAHHAMPDGGVFRITAENADDSDVRTYNLTEQLYIKLTVSDSGCGISRENLPKVFDPYFTTKDKGSGLGLATAYSIIGKHGGHIYVESEQDSGTTFHIYIPASDEKPVRSENAPGGPVPGKGHILVMDDEDLVREVSVKMLQRLGFGVATASSGQEALELYSSALRSGNRFDVVIMDLTIPGGMGGQELVGRLLEIDPETRAIVASGYSNDPVLAEYRSYGFRGIIAKPFSIAELSNSLHKVMED